MKHNSKQFLALFMAASMAVAPVSGVYAEDQNAAVENAVNANVQEGSEAEQNETASNAGQAESSVTAVESQEENKAEAAGKGTDTAEDEDAKKNAALAKLSVVSGTTGELKDGTYKVEAKVGGSSRTSITCEIYWRKRVSAVILRNAVGDGEYKTTTLYSFQFIITVPVLLGISQL